MRACALLLLLPSACGQRCPEVTLAGVPVTPELMALPVIGKLVDVDSSREHNGCEYGTEVHHATLGPLAVRYDVMDYKGQKITSGQTLTLGDCGYRGVAVGMSDSSFVELRHDPATGLYIVSGLMTPPAVTLRVTMGPSR